MTQSRLAKGMTRPSKYRKKPTMMNAQRLAVVKNVPTSTKPKTLRKATKPGEYKKIAKRTCRVVKYPMESTSAAASSRSALFSSDFTRGRRGLGGLLERPRAAGHLSCRVAVTEQRPDRHHPSCSLQSLRQARDDDRVPTSLGESIVQSQRRLEHGPADRQHFLTLRVHARIGIRRLDFPSPVSRAPAGVSLRVSSASGSAFLSR